MTFVRSIFRLGVLLALLLLSSSAAANRKFCTDIHYNYSDHIAGQDYLPQGGTVRAARHWMQVWVDNTEIWAGYADSVGCSPSLATQAGTIVTRTFPAIEIGSTYVWTFVDTTATWTYVWNNLGSMPASVGGSTTTHLSNVGFGFGGEGIFNVSALLSRLTSPESGFDFGLRTGTYRILAEKDCPGAISCFSTGDDLLYLGYDDQLWGWDNNSRSIIGHEFGHYVQHRLFGSPSGQTSYCHSVPTGNNNLCRCDHVDSPNLFFCGGTVPVNQAHCFQSRENLTAALGEGWGHFFATTLLNNPAGTDAKFAYYKHFKRADLQVVAPPVSHNPMLLFRWMENYCSAAMANLGTEMDWMGFLYAVRSTTTNKYSFTNLESTFEHSTVCNGTCNGSDTVTWSKLNSSVVALFSAAKASHFVNNAANYGVDH